VVALAIGGLVATAGRAAVGTTAGAPPAPYERHVVRAGDTLWGIARARVGPEGDPRPVVERIRSVNGLGVRPLAAGASIRVPEPP
jgi:nucleoid-associated protein YgaU